MWHLVVCHVLIMCHPVVPCREKDESLRKAVLRILAVWEERHVFEQESVSKFKTIISKPLCTHTHTSLVLSLLFVCVPLS